MDELEGSKQELPKKTERSKTITLNRNLFFVCLAVLVLILVFFLGSAYGGNKQQDNTNRRESSDSARSASSSSRWTSVGTVLEISDSKIKVVDSRKQEKTAEITKDTKIVNRKGETVKTSDIKKDQRVIISGEKDGDKLNATRIRLQQ